MLALSLACIFAGARESAAQAVTDSDEVIGEFLLLLLGSPSGRDEALDYVRTRWQPEFAPMLLEVLTFNRDPAFGSRLVSLLEDKTGETLGYDIDRWHEMFVDEVGGVPVAGVYCTLCGTMILYRTEIDGVAYELGTSGFLYRSNKLMYDRSTQSLWNTIWGEPVVGPLTGRGIALERMAVVTTTWGEWRRRHPQSQVLSISTGHARDYREGAAYREYFATDDLMFKVPKLDRRLKNKDEVLGLVFAGHPGQPLAIAASYLEAHRIYHDRIGDIRFVVLTDPSGANRVYQAFDLEFTAWDGGQLLRDTEGVNWRLEEGRLTGDDGRVLHRLPAQRAFWFGWFSAYNHTRLVE